MDHFINSHEWQKSTAVDFWGEIAPGEHVVQIYEDESAFNNLLSEFVSTGINAGDCVIVIATKEHLSALESELKKNGLNVFDLKLRDQFIAHDAAETLQKFMVNGWPDEILFQHTVTQLIARAHRNKRKVRAFGEMVALLWAQGLNGATVQLENLWNRYCETEALSLFCAYPRSGFTEDAHNGMNHICQTHKKVIERTRDLKSELIYREVKQAG